MHVLFWQQPVGHDVALHTQAPPLHSWPAAQGAPLVPQLQAPFRHWSAVVNEHAVQVAPLVPQAEGAGVVQTPPWQQPLGHDVALHTQAPSLHCCPLGHGAPVVPQLQPPLARQVLAVEDEQLPHATPPVPQVRGNAGPVVHTPFLQQPFGHDVALHTQAPSLHSCPLGHGAPVVPQLQPPLARQVLAVEDEQLPHATPPDPQVRGNAGLVVHTPFLQQPFGHDVSLHWHPLTH